MGVVQPCEGGIGSEMEERGRQIDQFVQFMRSEDYGNMLLLGMRHMTMTRVDGIPYELIAARIAENCPEDVKRKNPEKLLRLAYELYAGGLAEEYENRMREIREMIPTLPLPDNEKRQLTGEWLIVSALPVIRDIRKTVDIYGQAAELMSRQSAVIDAADPVTLGVHGVPGVYLLRPGMADEVRLLIPRLARLFSRFTGEPLGGMEELCDGSLAYYRGNLDGARQLTYKAIYLLEKTRQDVLKISAGEQLALIATHQGDLNSFEEAVDYMDAAAGRSVSRDACRCLVRLIRSGLSNTLGDYRDTPDWLKTFTYASGPYGTGPFGDRNVAGNEHFAPASYGVACWYHLLYLMQDGQYRRALAAVEVLLKRIRESEGVLILELYFTLLAARCHLALGDREAAQVYADRAAALAYPDRFILPLADFARLLDGMAESAVAGYGGDTQRTLRRLNNVYAEGVKTLRAEYLGVQPPESLTNRERDVARLAAEGLRNGEIAQRLFVSESTVRAHLRSVFQKLDIDRRAKLAEKLKKSEK